MTQVAAECESLAHSVTHLRAEHQKMAMEVEERIADLVQADAEVTEEVERERNIFIDACRRIEQEKISFLQALRDDFEAESSEHATALSTAERDINRYNLELANLKDHLTHCKTQIAGRLQTQAERTTADEQAIYNEIETEVNQELVLIARETEEMKEEERSYRKKLHTVNSKLEETRGEATRVLSNLRSQLNDVRNKLREAITEEKTLENQFIKREQQYNSFYETVEKEEREIGAIAMKLQSDLVNLVEEQERETIKIEEHIEGGRAKLEKIIYAIGEFKQENAKLREKNEKALSNLKMGLDDLIRGIVPHD